jgi:hypothetical protein
MQNPENFRLFYNQTIQPELQRLDKRRRRLLRWMFFSAVILAGILVSQLYIRILVVTLLLAIPITLYLGYLGRQVQKFRLAFKPRVVRLILDFIDDGLLFGDLKYSAKRKIPLEKFLESRIFYTMPAVYEGEDFIEGRIGDVEFEMCELRVEEFSRVRARLDEVFRGIFVRAKFVHPPRGSLLVVPKVALPEVSEALRGFVALGGQNMDPFLRNRPFTEIFTTYGSKDAKPNDLLPEELMDFILRYRRRAGDIYLSFFGNHIYAGIPNDKDILEPKLFQSNVSYELVREFYEDIYVALSLVIAFDRSH